MLTRAAQYWHTARHLKPLQIVGRWWFNSHRPTPDLSAAPLMRERSGVYVQPAPHSASMTGPGRFSLLGRSFELTGPGGWDDESLPKLERYNLHYFDDLTSAAAAQREAWHREIVTRWIEENPPARGIGWEPFPTSLRIVNWIKWALQGREPGRPVENSLAVQARWLSGRLEYHLLGNHLLANAKALIFAASYFDGAEAMRWYRRGLRIVEQQLHEQILPDGGHFELSPMYHAAVLEDLLDLINVLRAYRREPPQQWYDAVRRMRAWLAAMTHPDGEIAFFNDAAIGISASHAELEQYASRLLLPASPPLAAVTELDSSGYVRVRLGRADLICDCAAIGPDHLPAHAHADTLSFELSLDGSRVIVNSGTSEYGLGPERQRQRGTAAHNTVLVDGENSSEVWAGFRVARRARATMNVARETTGVIVIDGSHDGYRRLPSSPIHRRRWYIDEQGMRVKDHVSGAYRRAEARFHLHPDVSISQVDRNTVILVTASRRVQMTFDECTSVNVEKTTWHPRFGCSLPNSCVSVAFKGPSLMTSLAWGVGS